MKTRFLLILLSVALGSCASPYARNTLIGGYSDTRIDDSHYAVRFDGNGYSSQERVWNFWFYRCAELTAQKGYTFFALEAVKPSGVSLRERAPEEEGVTPAVYTPGVYTAGDSGNFILAHGGGGGGGGHFVYGGVVNVRTWHSNAIVAMYNGAVPNSVGMVYRAQSVLQDLGPFIQANGNIVPPPKESVLSHAAVATRSFYTGPTAPSYPPHYTAPLAPSY